MQPLDAYAANPPPETLFSLDALQRAWQVVRRNGASPGVDRVTPARFECALNTELCRLRSDILDGTYCPQPANRFYVLKANGKKRPLTVWAVRDRVAQRVVHDYLTPLGETFFLKCSYGFRPGRAGPAHIVNLTYGEPRQAVLILSDGFLAVVSLSVEAIEEALRHAYCEPSGAADSTHAGK